MTKPDELEIIDATKVPPRPSAKSPWEDLFAKIPSGKALVLRDVPRSTVHSALSRCQRRGRFKGYYATSRKTARGYISYVVNATKKGE